MPRAWTDKEREALRLRNVQRAAKARGEEPPQLLTPEDWLAHQRRLNATAMRKWAAKKKAERPEAWAEFKERENASGRKGHARRRAQENRPDACELCHTKGQV